MRTVDSTRYDVRCMHVMRGPAPGAEAQLAHAMKSWLMFELNSLTSPVSLAVRIFFTDSVFGVLGW